MTEAQLDALVAELAVSLRLYAYHTHDSRGNQPGFPDWVLVGPRGLLFRENKKAAGKLTPEQRAVGYSLQALGHDWAIWRPADWYSGRILAEMKAISARG